ncbi:HAD-IIIC family phosphatase [Ensifer sp. ENS06]|uniref:HAD-IIIC family phosphatase n=1 Tax=Ensifer sp. ENS06 TaxID=2769276 RepID=UPI00177F248B|nr:HAD-IIIC family phosphatase [Ensifer sp. ENS06]MBD9625264.1 HAD-IIIC family phosphatase [Ensifer sp. ENS06]
MDTAEFLFPSKLSRQEVKFEKILLIGSCLSETYAERLRESQFCKTCDFVLFNNAMKLPPKTRQEIADYDFQYVQIPLRTVLTDAIVIVDEKLSGTDSIDFLELGKRNIDLLLQSALVYGEDGSLLTLVSNFVVPQGHASPSLSEEDTPLDIVYIVRELNSYLAAAIKKYPNTFLADIEMIASSMGKRYFLDDTIYFYTHGSAQYPYWSDLEAAPYWTAPERGRIDPIPDLGSTYENHSAHFFNAVFRQMEAIYRTVHQIDMVKLVIFDLDNTLWRGILGDHYQPGARWPYNDGWPMGIWETIHHLKRRGIMVSIASKNDENYVKSRWRDVIDPSFIRFEDFISPQVNWEPKAGNVKKIIESLSLTPSSVVFVDDNPVERESVEAMLPGIRAIGSDPFVVRRLLLWSPEMQLARRTDESLRREGMLRQQMKREENRASLTREEFLRDLGATISLKEISSLDHPLFSRVFELVNKTNQFNTNGQRWSHLDFSTHLDDGGKVFTFSVRDKYTEYGTVGIVFIAGNDVKQYVMSCRVLGMEVELAALAKICALMREGSPNIAIGAQIVETQSNMPCRTLFSNAGFEEGEKGRFTLPFGREAQGGGHVKVEISS